MMGKMSATICGGTSEDWTSRWPMVRENVWTRMVDVRRSCSLSRCSERACVDVSVCAWSCARVSVFMFVWVCVFVCVGVRVYACVLEFHIEIGNHPTPDWLRIFYLSQIFNRVEHFSWNCNAILVSPKIASCDTVGFVKLFQEVSRNSFTKSRTASYSWSGADNFLLRRQVFQLPCWHDAIASLNFLEQVSRKSFTVLHRL